MPARAQLARRAVRAAVAAVLGRTAAAPSTLMRQQAPAAADAAAPAAEPVSLEEFLTTGTALNGQRLGFKTVFTYWVNAVELRFALGAAPQQYRDLRPRQYSGTEAVWIKRGHPFETAWINISEGPGTGWDDPLPQSITRQPQRIAYFDSPGPNLGPLVAARAGRPSWIYVVQNFTGWIEVVPTAGGSPQRISPVIPWYSIISVLDPNWAEAGAAPQYAEVSQTGAGRGWKPTTAPAL